MGLDVLHGSPALLLCGVLMLGTAVWGLTEVERVPEEQVFVLDDAAPSHSQYFETSIEQNMIWVQLLVNAPALSKDTVGLEILFYNVIEMSTPLLHLSYSVESIQRLLDEEMFFSWGPCPAELLAYSTDEDGGLVTSSASLTTMDGTWVMEALLVQPDGTNSTLSFSVVVGSGATAIDVGTRYSDSFATTNLYYTLEAPSVADSMLILSIANLNESLPLSSWLRALYWRKDSCPDVTAGGGNQTFLQGSVMAGPTVDVYLGAVDEASYLAFGVWSSYVAGSNGSDTFTLAYQTIGVVLPSYFISLLANRKQNRMILLVLAHLMSPKEGARHS